MPRISAETMEKMSAGKRAAVEVPDIVRTLRERGDSRARRQPADVLDREVRATLAACDRLELESDADRMTLCLLEITTFAGMRDLPRLRGLIHYAGGRPEARMSALFLAMPPTLWRQLRAEASAICIARGFK